MATAREPSAQTPHPQAAQDLFTFAVDRQDIKWSLARLPVDATVNPVKVDYELQILKIISVGWSLTYLLEGSPLKEPLQEAYWRAVQEFADRLSRTSGLLIGQNIDYFKDIKARLGVYLEAMAAGTQDGEPGRVIGAAFAELCGRVDDLATLMTGARMFTNALARVNEYLSSTAHHE
jgi:predicted transcriptional regulator